MKLHLICKIFILTTALSACAPTSYVYVKSNGIKPSKIDNVIIMVEYLSIKEGFDSHWDFDENTNIENQDQLYDLASHVLTEKGYVVSEKSLKTSGLVMDRGFNLDHFLNKKKQEQLISPPYIVRSVNLEDDNIQALEYLLAELNTPISQVMSDYRSHVKNNYMPQTSQLQLPENSTILVIQVYKPRKPILSSIDFGVNFSNSDSHVGFGSNQPKATSNAYLIHVGSGDVLWSNKIALITNRNNQKFFAELPNAMLD